MERRLKERLTGAVVLLLLAVIFVPMILDNSAQEDIEITETNIPPAPDVEFKSAALPVEAIPPVEPPPMPLATTEPDKNATSLDNTAPITEIHADNSTSPPPLPVTETAPVPVQTEQTAVIPANNENVTTQNLPGNTASRGMSAWVVQLGSFDSQANANKLVRQLQTQGFPAYIEKVTTDPGIVYKVRIGPELSRVKAEDIVKNLKTKMKLDGMILNFP